MVFLAAIIGSLVNNKMERMCKEAVIVHATANVSKITRTLHGERGRKNNNPQSERLALLRDLNPKPSN